jgi:hypothetical protein
MLPGMTCILTEGEVERPVNGECLGFGTGRLADMEGPTVGPAEAGGDAALALQHLPQRVSAASMPCSFTRRRMIWTS